MAAIGDLVHAQADQSVQPALVELIGDHTRDDRADRVPPDPQQPGDRREGHLLRQPGHDIFEVARVRGAGPSPGHGLEADPARRAAQPAQLALDPAATAAEIEVTPALDAPVVDLQPPAGLPHPPQTRRHRRSSTVTSTPRSLNETSMTLAPDRRNRRLNAVVIRTSPSSTSR